MLARSSFWAIFITLTLVSQVPFAIIYFWSAPPAVTQKSYVGLNSTMISSKAEELEYPKQFVAISSLVIFQVITLVLAGIAAFFLCRHMEKRYQFRLQQELVEYKNQLDLKHFNEWNKIARKLSHEIKNPLTPIEMTMSNLVRNHSRMEHAAFAEKLQETYVVIVEEVRKMGKLLNDFSRFSKLPAVNPTPHNVDNVLQQLVEEQMHRHPDASLQYIVDDKVTHMQVDIDIVLFNQCLVNIVDNAIEALAETQDKPHIQLQLIASQNDTLSIIVQNKGKSLSQEEREHIFDIYYTTKSSAHQMGLGLSIAKKIILEHNGGISCLPDNNGVTILITLPIRK